VRPVVVDTESPLPPSRQIVEAFLDAVAAGELRPGDRLPSVRDLAVTAMVNPNTAAKAYRDLGFLGVADARNGSGVFVAPGATEVARAARRTATLDAFRRAAAEAVRAGHAPERLAELLTKSADARAVAPRGEDRR
jgi:GntR family transcriptional regulator